MSSSILNHDFPVTEKFPQSRKDELVVMDDDTLYEKLFVEPVKVVVEETSRSRSPAAAPESPPTAKAAAKAAKAGKALHKKTEEKAHKHLVKVAPPRCMLVVIIKWKSCVINRVFYPQS